MKAVIETVALILFLAYVLLASATSNAYATPAACLFLFAFALYSWEIWFRPNGIKGQ